MELHQFDWSVEKIENIWKHIDRIGREEFGLTYYKPEFHVITSEQMMERYTSIGMPIFYDHWSFGKQFIDLEQQYTTGKTNLAYELVINSDPGICYLMETNVMPMQTLVMAHAVVGHGSFFKNNALFQHHTQPDDIVNFLCYFKNSIKNYESRYGQAEVTYTLDICHALQNMSVFYAGQKFHTNEELLQRKVKRDKAEQESYNELYKVTIEDELYNTNAFNYKEEELHENLWESDIVETSENILYLIAKYSTYLDAWQKDILKNYCKLQQYFYPQRLTKIINEGWATFIHYQMLSRLYELDLITDEEYMYCLGSHTGVVYQHPYSQINPYAIGFAIFMDLKRICETPEEQDFIDYPHLCNTDWKKSLSFIMETYKDDTFIQQYLTRRVVDDLGLMTLEDNKAKDYYTVTGTGYDLKTIRKTLAAQCAHLYHLPAFKGIVYRNGELEVCTLAERTKLLANKDVIAEFIKGSWAKFLVDLSYF